MRTRIDSWEKLEELPSHAVVYDHSNQVWQKLAAVKEEPGFHWFMPGFGWGCRVEKIMLPAYLLDDGL